MQNPTYKIKFSQQDDTIEVGCVNSHINDDNDALMLYIKDEGKGIPDDDIKLVFEKFTQSSSGKDVAQKGTGLGLSISKEIIQIHNGKIWAENNSGDGVTFKFLIPTRHVETE